MVLDEQHKVRQTPSLHYAFIFYTQCKQCVTRLPSFSSTRILIQLLLIFFSFLFTEHTYNFVLPLFRKHILIWEEAQGKMCYRLPLYLELLKGKHANMSSKLLSQFMKECAEIYSWVFCHYCWSVEIPSTLFLVVSLLQASNSICLSKRELEYVL